MRVNNKPRWAHFRKIHSYQQGDAAICGKIYYGFRNTVFVHNINEVTCPRCISELNKGD